MTLMASLIIKTTLVTAIALIAARLAHRSRAAVRHVLFVATFGALCLIPTASLLMPALTVVLPIRPPAQNAVTVSGAGLVAPVTPRSASANVRSARLKYRAPATATSRATAAEIASSRPGHGASSRDQRASAMTPDIGLRLMSHW